jgi:hypothetical protein
MRLEKLFETYAAQNANKMAKKGELRSMRR